MKEKDRLFNSEQAAAQQLGSVKAEGIRETRTTVRSNKQLCDELRTAPDAWVDAAIVVAFEDHFEFVREDHPDPTRYLDTLMEKGGLAVGLAGVKACMHRKRGVFSTQVFEEFAGQAWAHRYMATLRGIVRSHSSSSKG